jgi:propanediol dehydratase small subunit
MNTPHAPPSGWEAKFGCRRRAIDRALLAECERQITKEMRSVPHAVNPTASVDRDAERRRIALAFGRPLT